VAVVLHGRLPLLEPDPVAPLAEVTAGPAVGEAAVAAPADVPAVVDDQGEPADPGGAPRRQVVEGRDPVAPVSTGLDHHLLGSHGPDEADPPLEGPRSGHRGPDHRSLGLRVQHQAVERPEEVAGPERIGPIGEGRPVDDRGATGEEGHHRQRHAERQGAAIDGFLRSCYWLKHDEGLGRRILCEGNSRCRPPVTRGSSGLQTSRSEVSAEFRRVRTVGMIRCRP
jgi:hypothetical protein